MQYRKSNKARSESSTIAFHIPGCSYTQGEVIKSPEDVLKAFKGLSAVPVEMMVQIVLSARNHVMGVFLIGVGVTDACLVDPKVFARNMGVTLGASTIIIHNHPSGDVTPSAEDIRITKTIKEAVDIMNAKLIDHIIIGSQDGAPKSLSLREEGLVSFK